MTTFPPDDALVFSPDLQRAISDVLSAQEAQGTKSVDPDSLDPSAVALDELDREDFNPIDFINNLFPAEPTSNEIEHQIARIEMTTNRIETMVGNAIRAQSKNAIQGKRDLDTAKKSMQELFTKIADIKRKAAASESMVTEICGDIKQLDYGKKHLTSAIRALKKLQSMANAAQRLQVTLQQKQYEQSAKYISALNGLSVEFAGYDDIQRIKEITTHAKELSALAFEKAKEEFKSFELRENSFQLVIDVCSMIDALGDAKQKEFSTWFVARQMFDYKKAFIDEMEASRYENVEYRYSWFQKYFHQYKDSYGKIFPSNWGILADIAESFCQITKASLAHQLSVASVVYALKNDHRTVTTIIKVMEKTVEFENSLVEMFEPDIMFPDEDDTEEEEKIKIASVKKSRFKRSISSAMDSTMPYYISHEERTLAEVLERCVADETFFVEEDATNKILVSSTDIIFCMKQMMNRALRLCHDENIVNVFNVLMDVMRRYTDVIVTKINTTEKLTLQSLCSLCLIVNTGEYCRERAAQFATGMGTRVLARKEEISAERVESEIKTNCIKAGVSRLAALLCVKLAPLLSEVPKQTWTISDTVTDNSPYVAEITKILLNDCSAMAKWLGSQASYKVMCDFFVKSFSDQFYSTLKQCRRVNEFGARRLLLDLAAIKATMSELPLLIPKTTTDEKPAKANTRYLREVQSHFSRSESLLKVVNATTDTIIDTFITLFPTQEMSDFADILEIKGLSRGDKQALIDRFCQTTQQQRPKTMLNSAISFFR